MAAVEVDLEVHIAVSKLFKSGFNPIGNGATNDTLAHAEKYNIVYIG